MVHVSFHEPTPTRGAGSGLPADFVSDCIGAFPLKQKRTPTRSYVLVRITDNVNEGPRIHHVEVSTCIPYEFLNNIIV